MNGDRPHKKPGRKKAAAARRSAKKPDDAEKASLYGAGSPAEKTKKKPKAKSTKRRPQPAKKDTKKGKKR